MVTVWASVQWAGGIPMPRDFWWSGNTRHVFAAIWSQIYRYFWRQFQRERLVSCCPRKSYAQFILEMNSWEEKEIIECYWCKVKKNLLITITGVSVVETNSRFVFNIVLISWVRFPALLNHMMMTREMLKFLSESFRSAKEWTIVTKPSNGPLIMKKKWKRKGPVMHVHLNLLYRTTYIAA